MFRLCVWVWVHPLWMDHSAAERTLAIALPGQLPLTSHPPNMGGYGLMFGDGATPSSTKQGLERPERPPSRPSTLMGFMMSLTDLSSTLITPPQASENTSTTSLKSTTKKEEKGEKGEPYKDVVMITHLESSVTESWVHGSGRKPIQNESFFGRCWSGVSGSFCCFYSRQDWGVGRLGRMRLAEIYYLVAGFFAYIIY